MADIGSGAEVSCILGKGNSADNEGRVDRVPNEHRD